MSEQQPAENTEIKDAQSTEMNTARQAAEVLPVIALRGICLLPSVSAHFDIGRDISAEALERAMQADKTVFLVMQKDPKKEKPSLEDLHRVGTVSRIISTVKRPGGAVRVLAEGLFRARSVEYRADQGYLTAAVESLPDQKSDLLSPMEEHAMCRALKDIWDSWCMETHQLPAGGNAGSFEEMGSLEKAVSAIGAGLPVNGDKRQEFLEAPGLRERFNLVLTELQTQVAAARIKNDIAQQVKARIDKNQREYILREEMKVIRKELGDEPLNEAEGWQKKTDELNAAAQVKERITKEIRRFKSLQGNSPEASISRTYIETLLDLPWDKVSEDNQDLKHARQVLEEDHYGLEKVKERILEFLAVRTLTQKGDSPILCLAGPPGTGKTSIARSVARALNKKYVRISLGGVRDEAEIRGHRRTYLGAMPGRIAEGLRTAGVKNPLMLLDEIDKVSSDYKGDTASALLEVLDSEQNSRFRDHYIELPLDLSEVLFIATANDLSAIAQPLRDRCEIIEISSYTENEKMHIAKEHLVRKQIAHNGLKPEQLKISDQALKNIISGYTREAGVRQLERLIGQICRRSARQILEDGLKSVHVTAANLEQFLDKRPFREPETEHADEVGLVHGLAWTAAGGVTLEIEVNVMPGKGDFLLTGKMGDVMKESAQTAISFIRSVSENYGVDPAYFGEHDIHIHIPEGAVPKDGPSAGITMATAILSAVTSRKVRGNTAMTGEITLRGRVLPIGGLKEKLLAARNAGFARVLVPEDNRPDVTEISREITGKLDILYVKSMADVLSAVLEGKV